MDFDKLELTEEVKVKLREEETRLTKIIEALVSLDKSKEWSTLKELVYDVSVLSVERQILNICLNKEIDLNALYKLQGEWAWAKQHSDTNRFITTLKQQLEGIKNKLK